MDCFRSGRDGPDEPTAFPEALKGPSAGAEEGPPKKSKPNSESPCFTGALVGTGAFGSAARGDGSVVLGLAGGVGIPPRMSMFCGGLLDGPFGWLDAEEPRCDVERSNWAFSFTMLRGYDLKLVAFVTLSIV